jgi:hypothetical protein
MYMNTPTQFLLLVAAAASSNFIPALKASGVIYFLYTSRVVFMDLCRKRA